MKENVKPELINKHNYLAHLLSEILALNTFIVSYLLVWNRNNGLPG